MAISNFSFSQSLFNEVLPDSIIEPPVGEMVCPFNTLVYMTSTGPKGICIVSESLVKTGDASLMGGMLKSAVVFWDFSSNKETKRISGFKGIPDLKLTEDLVLVVSYKEKITLIDLNNWQETIVKPYYKKFKSFAINNDGTLAAFTDEKENSIAIIDSKTGALKKEFLKTDFIINEKQRNILKEVLVFDSKNNLIIGLEQDKEFKFVYGEGKDQKELKYRTDVENYAKEGKITTERLDEWNKQVSNLIMISSDFSKIYPIVNLTNNIAEDPDHLCISVNDDLAVYYSKNKSISIYSLIGDTYKNKDNNCQFIEKVKDNLAGNKTVTNNTEEKSKTITFSVGGDVSALFVPRRMFFSGSGDYLGVAYGGFLGVAIWDTAKKEKLVTIGTQAESLTKYQTLFFGSNDQFYAIPKDIALINEYNLTDLFLRGR